MEQTEPHESVVANRMLRHNDNAKLPSTEKVNADAMLIVTGSAERHRTTACKVNPLITEMQAAGNDAINEKGATGVATASESELRRTGFL